MLGVLHKVILGYAPEPLAVLFPVLGVVHEPAAMQRMRNWRPKHSKQLHAEIDFTANDVMQRSLFGLVHLYNKLLQSAVDASSVKIFQRQLQEALKRYARSGAESWQSLFSTKWRLMPKPQLHDLFG